MATTLIRNATLIDGTGRPPVVNAAILIKDNQIDSVGPAGEIKLPDSEMIELDAGGGFVLPGFFDTHVHLLFEGFNMVRDMQEPFSARFYKSVNYMRRTIEAGVTSVRDAGGADAGVKKSVDSGEIVGPRMQISISVLTITGGHGDGWMLSGNEWELFPGYPGYPHGLVDGEEHVRRKVREVLRAGAEVIKICATGGVLSPTDHPEFIQFSPEELRIIVEEAKFRRGVKVMAHAQGAEGIKNAVRAGIHSIEHGIYLDDEAIDLMLENGTFLVPTLLAPVGVLEAGEKGGMPDYGIRKAREVIDIHKESIAKAYKAGVKIVMGTDSAVTPHGENLRELGLMVDIGMNPMETIVSSTSLAAECLGWEEHLGSLEPGKLADLIVTKSDPLKDIHSLENRDNIWLVMKDGVVYKDLMAK
ncbi:MAG: amidohydrolase family protein [Anaerolineales bacterium]